MAPSSDIQKTVGDLSERVATITNVVDTCRSDVNELKIFSQESLTTQLENIKKEVDATKLSFTEDVAKWNTFKDVFVFF